MDAEPADTGPGRGGPRPAARGPESAVPAPRPAAVGTLTVLGCDGSYPGPGGAASGYLVERAGTTVWLDAGPGTFARLQLVKDPSTLDALVLSHEHPDHWTDFESFAVWRRQSGADRSIRVLAPPGLRSRSYFGRDRLLDWDEVEGGDRVEVGSLTLTFDRTDHGPTTLGVRCDPTDPTDPADPAPDAALAYSADTGPTWSVEALGSGIGTFLCEATYTRDREGSFRHLSGRQAGAMAAAAGVARLVVTHRWPSVPSGVVAAEADDAFGRSVHQAAPGRVFEW
ncbi:MAG: MBL fold metallo-hydrolase [Acidimicrobiales bacterium]